MLLFLSFIYSIFIFYNSYKREKIIIPYIIGFFVVIILSFILFSNNIPLLLLMIVINSYLMVMVIDDFRKQYVYTEDLLLMWVFVIFTSIYFFWIKLTIMWLIGNIIAISIYLLIALIVWYKKYKTDKEFKKQVDNEIKDKPKSKIEKIKQIIFNTFGEWDAIILIYLSLIVSLITWKIGIINLTYTFLLVFFGSIFSLVLILLSRERSIAYIPWFFVWLLFLLFFLF